MFWAIIRVVQIILWFCTFFLAKKTLIKEERIRSYDRKVEAIETKERFKFPLWVVLLGFILNLIPILGLIAIILFTAFIESIKDQDFDNERPSFFLVKIFTKKI